MSRGNETFDYDVAVATFAPGAYLNWHRHPEGQQLLILDGEGLYQKRGEAVQRVRHGDVVRCDGNVEHWHSSTPTTGVTYLALSGKAPTVWGETLTAEAYAAAAEGEIKGATEDYLLGLSRQKWAWMATNNVDTLAQLFHPKAKFIHMGANFTKEQELDVIRSGRIHYKRADLYEQSVEVMGNRAVVLNRITLSAVVGGNDVSHPFTVTEIYLCDEAGRWRLGSMAFTKLLRENEGEPLRPED